jgi:hypothetical protein
MLRLRRASVIATLSLLAWAATAERRVPWLFWMIQIYFWQRNAYAVRLVPFLRLKALTRSRTYVAPTSSAVSPTMN